MAIVNVFVGFCAADVVPSLNSQSQRTIGRPVPLDKSVKAIALLIQPSDSILKSAIGGGFTTILSVISCVLLLLQPSDKVVELTVVILTG